VAATYFGYLCSKKLYREGHRVRLIDPAQLADDALVACVNQMGAPLPGEERLTDPRVMAKAVRMMEEHIGARFTAVMPWEIGGGNGFQPILIAALFDLPVVDADAMGRAFPEATMTSFAVMDYPPTRSPWPTCATTPSSTRARPAGIGSSACAARRVRRSGPWPPPAIPRAQARR
jgi:DUF917 family protein